MRVRATRVGYDGFIRRKVGDVFFWPDNTPVGSWMEDASTPLPEEPLSGEPEEEVHHKGKKGRKADVI